MSAASFTCPRCGRTTHHPVDAREGYCGHCHDWTGAEAWARFRVYIGGELVDEVRLLLEHVPGEAEDLTEHHGAVCADAMARGVAYLVEVKFWDGEHVRWGTDVDGMVVPLEVGLHELAEAISRRWE